MNSKKIPIFDLQFYLNTKWKKKNIQSLDINLWSH